MPGALAKRYRRAAVVQVRAGDLRKARKFWLNARAIQARLEGLKAPVVAVPRTLETLVRASSPHAVRRNDVHGALRVYRATEEPRRPEVFRVLWKLQDDPARFELAVERFEQQTGKWTGRRTLGDIVKAARAVDPGRRVRDPGAQEQQTSTE